MADIPLSAYATGNAIPGGLSSVEGVSPIFAQRVQKMVAAMPPEIAQRFKIISGFRSAERQAQVNPGVTHSRHTGTGEPGSGIAVDLQSDPMVLAWINQHPEHGLGFPLKHMPNEQNHMEMLDDQGGRYAAAPAGYRSGLRRFGVAEANLPEVGGDYGGGGDLSSGSDQPAEPGLDPDQLRALLALQQGGGLAGRLGGPSSLSGALTQGMQPAPAQPQPILQPQASIIGGPLPISRPLT
jgi:hypothetical protein